MSERSGQSYYELLEVTPAAGPAEIYAAYQRARNTYSPNSPALYSMFSPQEAQELMALIEEAYQTLSHQARRREYDLKMGLVKPTVGNPSNRMHDMRAPTGGHSASSTTGTSGSGGGETWVGQVKITPNPRKDDLPKGFARTKFSVFEIKPEMEKEIEAIEECDGLFLQRIRLYRGVTLEQMSDEIRVVKSTLVALEANDLDALPVAVFTRGFVVQFARALGLNERKISDAYMKYFKAKKT